MKNFHLIYLFTTTTTTTTTTTLLSPFCVSNASLGSSYSLGFLI